MIGIIQYDNEKMENYSDQRYFQRQLLIDEKHAKVALSIIFVLLVLLLIDGAYLTWQHVTKSSAPSSLASPLVSPSPTEELSPTRTRATPTVPLSQTTVTTTGVKDYYISLGSGVSQAPSWEDVPGVQAIIDFGQYPNIKAIYFEVSTYIPTANQTVSVQLYNVTDNHPVWNSEIDMNAAVSSYRTSAPLSYDTGAKLYQVQMQTQLQSPATLVQSRIHIVLQ
jgi:hypothetical protein